MDTLISEPIAITGEVASQYLPPVLETLQLAADMQSMSPAGRAYIEQALKGTTRRPRDDPGKLGKYPSARMGCIIKYSQGFLGLATMEDLERDDGVVAILRNAPSLKVRVKSPDYVSTFLEAPFAIAVRRDRTDLVSVVPERDIRREVDSGTDRYKYEDGVWVYPSARDSAKRLGFQHVLITESDFPATPTRNYAVLDPYFKEEPTEAQRALCERIQATVRTEGPQSIFDLLRKKFESPVSINEVLRCIAQGSVVTDLELYDLGLHQQTLLFPDKSSLTAFKNANLAIGRAASWRGPQRMKFGNGANILWDGVKAKIEHKGASQVEISRSDGGVELPRARFDDLVQRGLIVQDPDSVQEDERARARRLDALDRIKRASRRDLQVANSRFDNILPYVKGDKRSPASRTIRRHLKAYRDSERNCGNGFVGLLPGKPLRERERKLLGDVLDITFDVIDHEYLSPKNLSVLATYELIKVRCEARNLPPPSYSWLCREIKKLDPYWVKLAREGSKAAYQVAPRGPVKNNDQIGGDASRVFERAHVDHTQIDLETIFEETGEVMADRPWLTVMLDHATRRVLGFHLSYFSPSYASVMAVIRDCVRRYGRLPDMLYVDNGPEFHSAYLEGVCHFYKVVMLYRPAKKPRFGAEIERFLGTTNRMLVHRMLGNTQLSRDAFMMTPEVDPANHAVWTLPAIASLSERFFFEIYDQAPHRNLAMSPQQCFELLERRYGTNPSRAIEYDDSFIAATCPTTPKGTAKATLNGVKINYFWFNSQSLYGFVGESVDVRFDPDDLSRAWAYLHGSWVPLQSKRHQLLRGLTERNLLLACDVFRARRGDVEYRRLNDSKLAAFMAEIAQMEELLAQQKLEAIARAARAAIESPDASRAPEKGSSPMTVDVAEPAFDDEQADTPINALASFTPKLLPTI